MRNELGPIIWVHNNWFKASLSKNTELVRRVLWTTSLCLTRQDKHSHRIGGSVPSRRPLRGTPRFAIRDADYTAQILSSATSTQLIGVDARHGFNAQQVGQPGGAFTNFGFFHPPTGGNPLPHRRPPPRGRHYVAAHAALARTATASPRLRRFT